MAQNIILELSLITQFKTPVLLGQSDSPSDWYSGGCGFDPWSGHIIFQRDLVKEIISAAILPLPLIQVEQLSITEPCHEKTCPRSILTK